MTINPKTFDWYKLSYVEYASGIEVFHAALHFRTDKNLQKKILDHALDEFRHSKYFHDLTSKEYQEHKVSTPHGLINAGGLANSPFLKNKNIMSLCCYLYLGEVRAIKFAGIAAKTAENQTIKNVFNVIDRDEQNHALGLKNYLKRGNKYKIALYILYYKIRFLYSDGKDVKIYSKLRESLENYIVRKIFNIFPQAIFELNDSGKSFESSFKTKKRMS
jgi:rubrerythrin